MNKIGSQGIWLELILIIVGIIAGVILIGSFVVSLISSTSALNFGLGCYTETTSFNLVNNYLFPITSFASIFTSLPSISPTSGLKVEESCIQRSNLNGYNTASLATGIYEKSGSCFGLFAGLGSKVEGQILSSKGVNQVFTCYYGKILSSSSNKTLTNFPSLISYIDNRYYNPSDPMQITFITNSSGGSAVFPSISKTAENFNITNGSMYSIAYFEYPTQGAPPSCLVDFTQRCNYDIQYDQPNSSSVNCASQSFSRLEPVSALSDWENNVLESNPPDSECIQNYTVSFCGVLLNTMIMTPNHIFVCITTK